MEKAKVYFIKDILDSNVVKIYKELGVNMHGNVALKVHSGEAGNQNFLRPEFMKPIASYVNATIVECNTAYAGKRDTTEEHDKLMEEHGWSTLYDVDILDRDGDLELPVLNGKHLKNNYVGKHLENYDDVLVLSHFKGHPMGGFGGALKNISIGLASSYGKANIHGAGNPDKLWDTPQNDFLESMGEACKTIMDYKKGHLAFINVMGNMSVDCDCCAKAEDPKIKDIGILASLDPVALDQACIDLVYASDDEGKKDLIERIESRNGLLTIETAVKLGVGTREYELIELD